MTASELAALDQIIAEVGDQPDDVVPLLQAIQAHFGYLPIAVLEEACRRTQIHPVDLAGVATFYDQFRHRPAGRHIVRVCKGTACHVRGADAVTQAIGHHLHIADGCDTDPQHAFTVEPVACLGNCTMAPVVQIDDHTYGPVSPEGVPRVFADFDRQCRAKVRQGTSVARREHGQLQGEIRVGLGSCCMAKGSDALLEQIRQRAAASGARVAVRQVGCVGMCHQTPLIEVVLRNGERCLYPKAGAGDIDAIADRHFPPQRLLARITSLTDRCLDWLRVADEPAGTSRAGQGLSWDDRVVTAFLGPQRHIATEHFGTLDPTRLDAYRAAEGFEGLSAACRKSPEQIISAIKASGLRGRGGGGFATADKWEQMRQQPAGPRYVICNGDEGDPGAFMDRMLLESFPFRVLEGMLIAARATGADEGIFYIRAEYPLALQRVERAIAACQDAGLLDAQALGTDQPFRVSIRRGAGAFICGEETALIAAIEGRRGHPRLRPPYPTTSGYRGRPTLINNVETLACVPWIMRRGAEAFAAVGTPNSRGTKVFALAGRIRRGGLIETPMGVTIREVVEEIGGGVEPGHTFKAVQIGGPSGGCLPASLADTPIDYEALRQRGAIMGSGGLIVLDDRDCMVDLARYFLRFTQQQSCGKCTFCRVGTLRMLEILDRICGGRGKRSDLDELERLGETVRRGSLCGLGGTAPNPVLTTLRYFHDEYQAHLEGRCPAGVCKGLIAYRINDRCVGCTICAQHCPVDAITARPYTQHDVDDEACTRCGNCLAVCPHDAVEIASPIGGSPQVSSTGATHAHAHH